VWSIALDASTLPQWTDVQGGNPYVVNVPAGGEQKVELKVVLRKRRVRQVAPLDPTS
jgi:hypothetical protein